MDMWVGSDVCGLVGSIIDEWVFSEWINGWMEGLMDGWRGLMDGWRDLCCVRSASEL